MQDLSQLFDMVYTQIDSSNAYKKYCELVHGKSLFQLNMTDITMIEELLGLLNLKENSKVLDLGCGLGGITEYILEKTNSSILGVDFSQKAISIAAKRVEGKSRIKFLAQDIESFIKSEEKFDAVIAIDSLMFVKDLNDFVSRLISIVLPGGRIGILYTQPAMFNDGETSLEPKYTRLGKALKYNHLRYKAVDFTAKEQEVWGKKIKYAEELKEEFIKENTLELCENCAKEAKDMLELIKGGMCKKYLYYVEL